MKIYFAGSIRGGRDDAVLYNRLISHMKDRGHCVLTEHIGLESLTSRGEDGPSDEWIYQRDMSWLNSCDIVIAECSSPSLGVGYELAYAEKAGKKVCVFYRSSRGRLSAMISGNSYFDVCVYSTDDELFEQLDKLL